MAALRQADELVEYLREWVPVYGESDLAAIAQVHGKAVAKPLDVAKRLASRRRVEPLSDPDTGEPIRLWRGPSRGRVGTGAAASGAAGAARGGRGGPAAATRWSRKRPCWFACAADWPRC